MPLVVPRYVRRIEVRSVVARTAAHGGCPVPIGTPHDTWRMGLHDVGLGRTLARRMAVQTARTEQHTPGFIEQCDRACARIRNRVEAGRRPQACSLRSSLAV